MGKLRLRDVKKLSQDHTANNRQSRSLAPDPDLLMPGNVPTKILWVLSAVRTSRE